MYGTQTCIFYSTLLFPLSPQMRVSIQGDIVDINDIFRDLGTLVHEQGEVVGKNTIS